MSDLIEALESICEEKTVVHGEALADRHFPNGQPYVLVRPTSTNEVSRIMALCHERGQPVIPLGGLTGLVKGTASNQTEVAISFERMNKVEETDVASRTMTLQVGVPLQVAQESAEEAGMLFPLDLGARGTATVGGNVSTNAGGNRVIRYGMMRDQVLGMEVVLADGTVISSMNKIIKNNTGYDLKHLFIGAEGTLGVVTRLVLRLRPAPRSQEMAFVAVDTFEEVTTLLNHIDSALGGSLSAYEVLWKDYYELVTTPPAKGAPPVAHGYNYYILIEALGGDPERDTERFLGVLSDMMEQGIVTDAVVAQSQADRDAMWAIRDDIEQLGRHAPNYTFDVSIPLNLMESYVEDLKDRLDNRWPGNSCMIFGHLGDGNLHVIVGVGEASRDIKKAVEQAVYEGLQERGGSISAEHGIGVLKRDYLGMSRSEDELALMQVIKKALDPKDILNPGKIFG